MTLPAGTRVGSYELFELPGAGGMGEVRDHKHLAVLSVSTGQVRLLEGL